MGAGLTPGSFTDNVFFPIDKAMPVCKGRVSFCGHTAIICLNNTVSKR